MTELLRCPCCGADAEAHERDNAEGYRHFVECGGCCLRGDNYLSAKVAVMKWNLRAGTGGPERMQEALTRAAAQFASYAEQHRAKGTPEGEMKAATNDHFAALCRAAIGS